jgi:ATP-dependent Clp protease adaptor protein ClpS
MTSSNPTTSNKTKDKTDHPWNAIVWNDDINLMSYVIYVFKKVLGMSEDDATKHMLEVHKNGSSIVASTDKEKCEFYVVQLKSHGLKASMEKP